MPSYSLDGAKMDILPKEMVREDEGQQVYTTRVIKLQLHDEITAVKNCRR